MQLSLPWRRGQVKPFTSIPRINWDHPLARKLAYYVYDCGGFYYDLVGGAAGILLNGGTYLGQNASSPYGSAFKFPLGGSTSGGGPAFYWPSNAGYSATLASVTPYSFSAGFLATNYPAAQCTVAATVGIAGTTADASFGVSALLSVNDIEILLGPNFVGYGTALFPVGYALNTFHTASVSVPTSTTATTYADGVKSSSFSGTSVLATAGKDMRIILNDTATNAGTGAGWAGFVYYHCCWNGRVLTDAEHAQLHADPYCFLIYPEDDVFAMLKGTPPVAPTIHGATLPFMGVG